MTEQLSLEMFYNTNICKHHRHELIDLGYISLRKLGISLKNRQLLINELKKEANNFALNLTHPITPYVLQQAYNESSIGKTIKAKEESRLNFKSNEEKIKFLSLKVSDSEIDTRVKNCLEIAGKTYLYEIPEFRPNLLKIQNFGERSMEKLENYFLSNGVDLLNIQYKLIATAKFLST